MKWELARAILLGRLKLAWGKERGEAKFNAIWPHTDKDKRAHQHNPNAEVELALASADEVQKIIESSYL